MISDFQSDYHIKNNFTFGYRIQINYAVVITLLKSMTHSKLNIKYGY